MMWEKYRNMIKCILRRKIMKKTVLNYFCIKLLLLCFASMLIAAPTPAVGPLDVEGKVLRVDWSPKKSAQGIPGMSGTMGIDRIIPAHFRVYLTDYSGVDADVIGRMKAIYRWPISDNLNTDGTPEFIVLQLSHEDKTFIRKGMKIRVRGYLLKGDEGGDWTSYQEIQILSQ